jgi:two-component system, chemotaxis family, chemotaxis protein CheY
VNILTGKQILVIDDMKITRKLVIKLLIKLGASEDVLLEASNGIEAQELLSKHNFDLIVSDWNMPEMSGLELLKFCKTDEKLKKIPFVLLTSESESNQIAEALDSRVDLYLVKPIQEDLFMQKIMKLMK